MSVHSNQGDLHTWFRTASSNSVVDRDILFGLMCYGFCGLFVEYGGNTYVVNTLIKDPHSGVNWYPKPHLRVAIEVRGVVVDVSGTFWHRKCIRMAMSLEPFPYLTCHMCARIPRENDFRMRIKKEAHALLKRGHTTTGGGIQLGYLFVYEVSKHTRELSAKYWLEKLHDWHARTRIVQLKARRQTMRESAINATSDNNLMKFFNNIISAHRIGAFGSKPGLWDFMKDVVGNLNRKGRGNRFSENTTFFHKR